MLRSYLVETTHEGLRAQHIRWRQLVGAEEYAASGCMGIHEVLDAHFALLDYFSEVTPKSGIGGIGPRSEHLLHSAVSRQFAGFGGLRKYTDRFDVCATLFYGLAGNHVFHDCNKRTALLTALRHLQKMDRTPTVGQKDLEDLAVATATHDFSTYRAYCDRFSDDPDGPVRFLGHFFRRHTREIDRRPRLITFRQLDTALRRFGFRMDSPADNRIDIVKDVEKQRLFRGPIMETVRMGRIGFPGWKSQVSAKDVKYARQITKLLPEFGGVDSAVFFENLDPVESLITEYAGPLRRLADR